MPPLSPDEAAALLRVGWGRAGTLAPLDGERDQNLRVDAEDGQRYVLKIHHPAEDPAVAEVQSEVLRHLEVRDPGLPVPHVVPTLAGASVWRGPEGRAVRLLRWVHGAPLSERLPLGPEHLRSLGRLLARLDRALSDYAGPRSAERLPWDVQHALQLRPLLDDIPDTEVRRLVRSGLDDLEVEILPRLPALPHQVVHDDAHPDNVLADAQGVTGLLDFGDLSYAPRIQELAIACSYLVRDDPIGPLWEVTAAYHAILPLTRAELAVLPGLIRTRWAASVCIACGLARRKGEDPAEILSHMPRTLAGLRSRAIVAAQTARVLDLLEPR